MLQFCLQSLKKSNRNYRILCERRLCAACLHCLNLGWNNIEWKNGIYIITYISLRQIRLFTNKNDSGSIASNYINELVAIFEALNIYLFLPTFKRVKMPCWFWLSSSRSGNQTHKLNFHSGLNLIKHLNEICALKYLTVHNDITDDEIAVNWPKNSKSKKSQKFNTVTHSNANTVLKFRLKQQSTPLCHQLCNIAFISACGSI